MTVLRPANDVDPLVEWAEYSSSTLTTCGSVEQSSEMHSSQFADTCRRTDSMARRRYLSLGRVVNREHYGDERRILQRPDV